MRARRGPEFVQMLLVAFSRRMCCSRVDMVSTKPRRPSSSTVSPQRRPGICRTNFLRQARSPRYGPPKFRPLPMDWPSAATMSAPIAPGDFSAPKDTASVTTTIKQRARRLRLRGQRRDIAHAAEHVGDLHDDAGGFLIASRIERTFAVGRRRLDRAARITRDRLDHGAIMRMKAARQHRLLALREAMRHQHGLGRRGRAVIHRGVRHLHAGRARPPASGTRTDTCSVPCAISG